MFLTLLVCTLPALPLSSPPQEAGGGGQNDPVLVQVDELDVRTYRPQHVNAQELTRLAQRMFGRDLYVFERGGYSGDAVTNVQLIGDTLVLYDKPDYLGRMETLLKGLDKEGMIPEEEPEPQAPARQPLETWHYPLRYLSLEAVYESLQPLRRIVPQDDVPQGRGAMVPVSQVSNISVSEERRLLVVRDTPERVGEIRELLKSLDVPQEQMRISCWLLQGGAGEGEPTGLPEELSEHLARLVPGQRFGQIGFALLHCSVSTKQPVSVQLDAAPERQYQLDLLPLAYDPQSGSLTVSGCALRSFSGSGDQRLFSTAAVLRGGEITVIGASGSKPILVAIRVERVEE